MSELKQLLESQDASLYEVMRELGMLRNYQGIKRNYDSDDASIGELSANFLLGLSNYFNISLEDILNLKFLNGSESKFYNLKDNCSLMKAKIDRDHAAGKAKKFVQIVPTTHGGKFIYLNEKVKNSMEILMFDNELHFREYLSELTEDVNKRLTQDTSIPDEIQNIPAREGVRNTPVRPPDDTSGRADLGRNIPMRANDPTYLADTQNIPMRELAKLLIDTQNITEPVTEDDVESALNDTVKVVYHNNYESNSLMLKQRKLMEDYRIDPDALNYRYRAMAKHHMIQLPKNYFDNSPCIMEVYEEREGEAIQGGMNFYYSVFNRENEFLFSEVYSGRYFSEGDTKTAKFYRKIFYTLIDQDMEFEFDEEDEISEADFYYAYYKYYKHFGPVY